MYQQKNILYLIQTHRKYILVILNIKFMIIATSAEILEFRFSMDLLCLALFSSSGGE